MEDLGGRPPIKKKKRIDSGFVRSGTGFEGEYKMAGDAISMSRVEYVAVPYALALHLFFFSSRRRHTRYIGDWSSDVCSSDLKKLTTKKSMTSKRLERQDEFSSYVGVDLGDKHSCLCILDRWGRIAE